MYLLLVDIVVGHLVLSIKNIKYFHFRFILADYYLVLRVFMSLNKWSVSGFIKLPDLKDTVPVLFQVLVQVLVQALLQTLIQVLDHVQVYVLVQVLNQDLDKDFG